MADAIGVVPTHDRDEAVRQLYEHGVCVLASVLPAAEVGALREAAVSTAKQHDQGVADPTWHVPGIFSIDAEWPTQRFVEHVAGPRVLAVLDEVFATAPGDYRVHSSTVQVNKPFCSQEAWHIDSWISQRGYCPAPHAHIRRTGYVNALWMLSVRSHSPPLSLCGGLSLRRLLPPGIFLSVQAQPPAVAQDWTTANGGTWVLSGTHALAEEEQPSLPLTDKPVRREMKRPKPAWEREPHPQALHVTGSAGDVCLMDCRLWVSRCSLALA